MKKTFAAILVCVFGFLFPVMGQSSAEALKNLKAAMKKEIENMAKSGDDTTPGGADRSARARVMFDQFDWMLSSGEPGGIEQGLNQVMTFFNSEEVRQQAVNVRSALKKERETKENAYVAGATAALKQAADAIKASDPQELDAVLKNLSQYQPQFSSERERISEAGRAVLNKIQPTLEVLVRWQNYLAARKSGNSAKARQSLQELADMKTSELIPRSQILAELGKYPSSERTPTPEPRVVKPEEIDQIVSKVKTLDEISDTIHELQKLQGSARSGYQNTDPLAATINALLSIERTYREFQAGLPTKIDGPPQGPDATSSKVAPLKVQLLQLVLPRYLNLRSDLALKSGESIQAFLQRVNDEARQRADTALLQRTKSLQILLTTGAIQTYDSLDNGFTSFAAGQNQEAAGQFMLAVISYQNALRSGSSAVPVKLIGERLTALKAAHPQEYEQGMTQFLNPPRPVMRPDFPSREENPTALPIPGISPTVAPKDSIPQKPTGNASPPSAPKSQ